ncbi:hypothetical protein CHU98_g8657 [Xylaria longipes]|nr:hypothetical protein CHU98_g8657 [Xylaria longipes]
MCIEVYNQFADGECQHKEYQNTFRCRLARGDQVLEEGVYRPPNAPSGPSGCTVRKAIRPTTGKCRRCRRRLLHGPQSNKSESAAVLPSNSVSSAEPIQRTTENS